MPPSRIFVSYVRTGDERGTEIADQIVTDLISNHIEVVTDDERISDENFMAFLNYELPRCHYLLFIQTPAALRSLRVQTTVSMAFTLATQRQTPKILRLIGAPSEAHEVQPGWNTVRTFDASVDYARACARLLLDLGLIPLDESSPFLPTISGPLSGTPVPPATSLPGIISSSGNLYPPAPPAPSLPGIGSPGAVYPSAPVSGTNTIYPSAPAPGINTVYPSGPISGTHLSSGSLYPPAPSSASLPGINSSGGNFYPPAPPANPPQVAPAVSGQLASVGAQQQATFPPPINQISGPMNPYAQTVSAPQPLSTPPSLSGTIPYQPAGVDDDRPASLKRTGWLKNLTHFSQTLHARMPALTGGSPAEVVLNDTDRPLPLNTTRHLVLRWSIAIALILILVTGTTVILVQGRNQSASRPDPARTATTSHAHQTPAPSATKRATSTPQPFPTQGVFVLNPDPQSPVDVYASGSTLTLNDTLASNDSTYQWQVSSTSTSGCQFKNTAYDLLAPGLNTCLASKSNFSNFVYQVEVKIVQGTTAGILFRANSTKHTGYFLQITTDGHVSLWRLDAGKTSPVLLPKTSSQPSAVHKGLGQPNVIAVYVKGNTIAGYVNKLQVFAIQDSTYPSGSVGVVAGQTTTSDLNEAVYQYAKVWTLA